MGSYHYQDLGSVLQAELDVPEALPDAHSITSSSHVFTNPESAKLELFPGNLSFALISALNGFSFKN